MKIKLTRGQSAIVDAADFALFGHLEWYASWDKTIRGFYARRNLQGPKRGTQSLHRAIMGNPVGLKVDHKNHKTLDCRRSNLRVCTSAESARNRRWNKNRHGVKGVCWIAGDARWRAQIRVSGKLLYLGQYKSKKMAGLAYLAANKKHFGEFSTA